MAATPSEEPGHSTGAGQASREYGPEAREDVTCRSLSRDVSVRLAEVMTPARAHRDGKPESPQMTDLGCSPSSFASTIQQSGFFVDVLRDLVEDRKSLTNDGPSKR
jgi:hypothetical protein